MSLLSAYLPGLSWDGMTAFFAVLVVMSACAVLGAAVGVRERNAGGDMIVGIGLAGGLLALWGVAGLRLSWGMGLVGILVLAAFVSSMRRGTMPGGLTAGVLLIMAPFLLVAAGAIATMWDDFSQWLPNAAYVYRYDYLPAPGLPESLSRWPAYPYTMPFIVAASSWLTGRFLESAGPTANVALLAVFGAMLMEAMLTGRATQRRMRWAAAGTGAALATILNPSFDAGVVYTSYSDVATAVVTAACALFGASLVTALTEERAEEARGLAWRFGFAAVALLNLKQANLVILVLIVAALAYLAVLSGRAVSGAALRLTPRMLLPPAAFYAIWRSYVAAHLTGGEMRFGSFSQWNFDVIGTTLSEIARLMAERPLFYTLMYAVAVWGLLVLRRPDTPVRRLLVVSSLVWLGYNAFLILIYLGAMTRAEASAAADYWRYAPHVGLLGLSALALRVADAVGSVVGRRTWMLAPAVSLALVPAAALMEPPVKAWRMHFRQVGLESAALLPDGAQVAIHGAHFSDPMGIAICYDLSGQGLPADRGIRGHIVWHGEQLPELMENARRGILTHIVLTDYVWPMDWAERDLGLPRLDHETALFAWAGTTWRKLRSWPTPPKPAVR